MFTSGTKSSQWLSGHQHTTVICRFKGVMTNEDRLLPHWTARSECRKTIDSYDQERYLYNNNLLLYFIIITNYRWGVLSKSVEINICAVIWLKCCQPEQLKIFCRLFSNVLINRLFRKFQKIVKTTCLLFWTVFIFRSLFQKSKKQQILTCERLKQANVLAFCLEKICQMVKWSSNFLTSCLSSNIIMFDYL